MSDRRERPKVWALLSDTMGDNAQVLALAHALGWPYELHRFRNRKGAMVANLVMGTTPAGMVKHISGDLGPPWPDLLISAGTPSEPACAQIRALSRRVNHPIYHVFLGRPWAKLDL